MFNDKDVFITQLSTFLPNDPVSNDDIEHFLGCIKGFKSRIKNIILRNNGIKTRYYAMDRSGKSTHSNAELTAEAIKKLFTENAHLSTIELIACGTSSPDHLVPSHAAMVQGLLGCNPIEVISPAGTCNSGMLALKYGYLSVLSGLVNNAVCSGSEKISVWLKSYNFEQEAEKMHLLEGNPYIAFEREFLRYMLSDGAGAALLQNTPSKQGISLKIHWIENISFANELPTCMFAGGLKSTNNHILPWRELTQQEQMQHSAFALQQDTRLLEKYITAKGAEFLAFLAKKHKFIPGECDYFLPHMSSEFFRKKILEDSVKFGVAIPENKWFTNLDKVGNIGAASPYVMLCELFHSGRLKQNDTILLMVPESARFSYTYVFLSVVTA